jgi:hypothetical protein
MYPDDDRRSGIALSPGIDAGSSFDAFATMLTDLASRLRNFAV